MGPLQLYVFIFLSGAFLRSEKLICRAFFGDLWSWVQYEPWRVSLEVHGWSSRVSSFTRLGSSHILTWGLHEQELQPGQWLFGFVDWNVRKLLCCVKSSKRTVWGCSSRVWMTILVRVGRSWIPWGDEWLGTNGSNHGNCAGNLS
jgi:hypothetical protein